MAYGGGGAGVSSGGYPAPRPMPAYGGGDAGLNTGLSDWEQQKRQMEGAGYVQSRSGSGGWTRKAPASGGGTPGSFSQYPQMPYQPQGPKAQSLIDPLASTGQGLLDPSSAYHQRMQSQLSEGIGKTSAAQQRAAALRAAQAGMGGGASPELLETQADIGRSGLEATGDAYGRAMLGGMELGGQQLGTALSGQLGQQGQQLQGYLAQQQGAANQEAQRFQAALEQQRMQQQMLLQQMQMYGSMF